VKCHIFNTLHITEDI